MLQCCPKETKILLVDIDSSLSNAFDILNDPARDALRAERFHCRRQALFLLSKRARARSTRPL